MSAWTRAVVSLAIIVVSALATWWAVHLRPPPPPPPREQFQPLFDFSPEDVKAISVESWQGRLEAAREDGRWQVRHLELRQDTGASAPAATPGPATVDEEVGTLVAGLVRLPEVSRFPREGRPLAAFGLDDPEAKVVLDLASGERREILLGDHTATGAGLYAQAPPPDDVLQVGSLVLSEIGAAFYRLRGLATSTTAPSRAG